MKLTLKEDENRDAGSFDDSRAVKERALEGDRTNWGKCSEKMGYKCCTRGMQQGVCPENDKIPLLEGVFPMPEVLRGWCGRKRLGGGSG